MDESELYKQIFNKIKDSPEMDEIMNKILAEYIEKNRVSFEAFVEEWMANHSWSQSSRGFLDLSAMRSMMTANGLVESPEISVLSFQPALF